MAQLFFIPNYIVEAKEILFKIKLQNFKETMHLLKLKYQHL